MCLISLRNSRFKCILTKLSWILERKSPLNLRLLGTKSRSKAIKSLAEKSLIATMAGQSVILDSRITKP